MARDDLNLNMLGSVSATTAATASTLASLAFLVLLLSVPQVPGQLSRRIIGDIAEQKISDVSDPDEREDKVYRRPPTYLILASKIVRPSTVYQVRETEEDLQKYVLVHDPLIQYYNLPEPPICSL